MNNASTFQTTWQTEALAELTTALGAPVTVTDDPDAPFPFAVYDPETGDLLGAGDSRDEAIEDAMGQAREWESAS
jgi:hypothetical protein